MKLRVLLAVLVVLTVASVAAVRAQTGVTEQTPAQRCGLAQNYLKNIQKPRDLRARVDRLQAYRYIQQRLEVFVVRLEKNDQPHAQELRTQLIALEQAAEAFKNHYEAYDLAREAVVSTPDYSRNTSLFQERLTQARAARQRVHEDVLQIQNLYNPEVMGQLVAIKQKLEVSKGSDNE